MPAPPAHEPFKPLPRSLLLLVGAIALIELLLSAADAGLIADPTLRTRVLEAGAFWSPSCAVPSPPSRSSPRRCS